MQRNAVNAEGLHQADEQGEPESVVVHVQLRPRRGATRRCLAALAALAAEHGRKAPVNADLLRKYADYCAKTPNRNDES